MEIPYKSIVMRLDHISKEAFKELENGEEIVYFKEGDFKHWLKIHRNAVQFKGKSDEEVKEYFDERFSDLSEMQKRVFFLKVNDEYIGTCMSWQKDNEGKKISVLHWLAVEDAYANKGYARKLITHCIKRFIELDEADQIYLHTQPSSYKAIKLYHDFGFRFPKKDCYTGAINENIEALTVLEDCMDPMILKRIKETLVD